MRRAIVLVILLAAPAALADHAAVARTFVETLGRGDFAGAAKQFDATMAKLVPEAELAKAWKATVGDLGPFQSVESVRMEAIGGMERAVVRCRLPKATMDVHVGFKGSDEVAALHMEKPWPVPAYVDESKFTEREVLVGEGAKGLAGTLSVPKGKGPFPALFLVHGSGPNNRDEAMPGGARTFRDLAEGLASRGVVVLRYDKRTYGGHIAALGVADDQVTIKEEYLVDVAAAAELLRATPEVDKKRIYLLGHSMGGYLAPKLLAADPALAGGVILAGTARHMEDILVPQARYLADASMNPLADLGVDDMKTKVERVKNPKLPATTPASDLPLGLPYSYWMSVRGYDPPETALKLAQPLLILQGERDYQVTPAEDFALWKRVLGGKKNVKFVLYPKLNHAFFAGEGKILPDEYLKKTGSVPAQVIADIAAFTR